MSECFGTDQGALSWREKSLSVDSILTCKLKWRQWVKVYLMPNWHVCTLYMECSGVYRELSRWSSTNNDSWVLIFVGFCHFWGKSLSTSRDLTKQKDSQYSTSKWSFSNINVCQVLHLCTDENVAIIATTNTNNTIMKIIMIIKEQAGKWSLVNINVCPVLHSFTANIGNYKNFPFLTLLLG